MDTQDFGPHTMFNDVKAFHRKMGLPYTGDGKLPHLMSHADFKYRTNFLFEELREFIEAHAEGDLIKAFDSLMDLAWVAMGTAHYLRVPWNEGWKEVARANMEKRPWQEGDPIKPRNYIAGEVVKPPGWKEPDLHTIMARWIETEKASASWR